MIDVWPLGNGVVIAGTGIEDDGSGSYWIAACADGYTEDSGKSADEAWDHFLANKQSTPHTCLHFATIKSVDNMILWLKEMRQEMIDFRESRGLSLD